MPTTLSIRQTCEELSLGRTSIYAMLKSKKLKAIKAGRRTLVVAASVQEFVDQSLEAGR